MAAASGAPALEGKEGESKTDSDKPKLVTSVTAVESLVLQPEDIADGLSQLCVQTAGRSDAVAFSAVLGQLPAVSGPVLGAMAACCATA